MIVSPLREGHNSIHNAAKVMLGRQRVLSHDGHDVVIENSVTNDRQPPVTGEEVHETVRVMELIIKMRNIMILKKLNMTCPSLKELLPERPI